MAESGSQAVVLGAGIAGLLAARVLSEFYASVVVLERDVLPDHPGQRKGVPQGRHLHQFLSRGTQILGELFPGLFDELVAAGAAVDQGDDLSRLYIRASGYELNPAGKLADPGPLAAYQASRPFVECHLRQRVAALGNVTIHDNHEAIEPLVTAQVVNGVRIVNRDNDTTSTVDANLVVDATGRSAKTPAFLETHGYGAPPEERIPSTGGYSSHLMRIAPGRLALRLAFVNNGSRAPGAMLVAYERDTWMLAIARPAGHGNPPSDFAEMVAAAEQMFPESIAAALRDATPVGEISVSRNTSATWRRYDQMSGLPAGLLALGDAVCNLNPLHGQGMTMAALHALALRDCLRSGDADLPRRFYSAAAGDIRPVWQANRATDQVTSVSAARSPQRRLLSLVQRAALRAASHDIAVTERFLRVRGLVDPPERLQDPALFVRILLANLRHPW